MKKSSVQACTEAFSIYIYNDPNPFDGMEKQRLLSSRKGKILGIILAIILSFSSYQIATIEHNVFDEFNTTDQDWDFSSGLSLSSTISTRQLLATSFDAFEIREIVEGSCSTVDQVGYVGEPVDRGTSTCRGYGVISEFYFYNFSGYPYSVRNIDNLDLYYYQPAQTELEYQLDPTQGIYQAVYTEPLDFDPVKVTIDDYSSLIGPLVSAFSQDVAQYDAFTTTNGEEIQDMYYNLGIGDKLWTIHMIFTDGTLIQFYYYGDQIIVRYIELDLYLSLDNGYQYGHFDIYEEYPSYVTTVTEENVLPNFVEAIIEFYGAIINE